MQSLLFLFKFVGGSDRWVFLILSGYQGCEDCCITVGGKTAGGQLLAYSKQNFWGLGVLMTTS